MIIKKRKNNLSKGKVRSVSANRVIIKLIGTVKKKSIIFCLKSIFSNLLNSS